MPKCMSPEELSREVDRLQEENDLLRGALGKVEWASADEYVNDPWVSTFCAWRGANKPKHYDDCLRQVALRGRP